jgi:hypothetical protein
MAWYKMFKELQKKIFGPLIFFFEKYSGHDFVVIPIDAVVSNFLNDINKMENVFRNLFLLSLFSFFFHSLWVKISYFHIYFPPEQSDIMALLSS